MNQGKKKHGCLTMLLIILALVIGLILVLLGIRAVRMKKNNKVPEGGINESMYVEINGTKQWINIYGEKKDNPVLLYLHGGPGSAVSPFIIPVTRKWAAVYTVVTWDQRACGKSWLPDQDSTPITFDLMMQDGKEMTEYLRKYLNTDKITLLGHSWGSYLGANLVQKYPEYYDCFIGVGQLVDWQENEKRFEEAAKKWVGTDSEGKALLEQLSTDHNRAKSALLSKYGYADMDDKVDYNAAHAMLYNPYYSLGDWKRFFSNDGKRSRDFFESEEFQHFSLLGSSTYEIPFYNINGEKDYMVNAELAQEYFDTVEAPRKKLWLMEDTRHGLLITKTEMFSEILHEIAAAERQ